MMIESLSLITNLGLVLIVMTTLMAIRLSFEVNLIEPGAIPNQAKAPIEKQKEK